MNNKEAIGWVKAKLDVLTREIYLRFKGEVSTDVYEGLQNVLHDCISALEASGE